MEDLTQSLNRFGIELFKTVYSQSPDGPGSCVISSVSVFIALMMTLAGSRGETKSEILKALKIHSLSKDENESKLHESINSLSKLISSNESWNKVVLANRMIINNLNVKNAFEDIIQTIYESEIEKVSADRPLNVVIRDTNKWISDLTNDKITNILDESFKSVALTLINAVYFKCEWLNEFDPNRTQKMDFYVTKSSKESVEMMQLNNKKLLYHFSSDFDYHLLSLPYKQEKYFFNIVFPSSEDDFLMSKDQQSLVNRLDFEQIKIDLQNLEHKSINLKIPKFTIKYKINLNEVLKKLGILAAFDRQKADFQEISETDIFVQEVLQYSYIEVNEQGTEAAAATVVKMVKRSISQSTTINLNRPFLYFITEKSSGAFIFVGSFNGNVEQRKNLGEKTEL
ncbi:serine ase inhibitor [Brachionus plicatilis]|uniref:Serine ase inhibitor n=1 Tax=Brachionus plicatilis TaxID=10195 RepID=A0A3M7QLW8_BRAPC|nr:serine ase inhibitor [Brachionus plicatilis]